MAHGFAEIAFTPTVRDIQTAEGSRESYASFDQGPAFNHRLTEKERQFIGTRDSFYMASVGETGWPYIQHRGGPLGFLKVLDDQHLGFADYAGNRQYISRGNFASNDRVALFFMDYANRRRLKLLGRVRVLQSKQSEEIAALLDTDYLTQVERGYIVTVEGFDWNCPQHITPRFSLAEVRAQLAATEASPAGTVAPTAVGTSRGMPAAGSAVLGQGPLQLEVSALRQLTPSVRAFELRSITGEPLPRVSAGSNIRIPIRLPDGALVDRQYSISSDPNQQEFYEIAVLREDEGRGSQALHDTFQLGTRLDIEPPGSQFSLHEDERPAMLIAGGIGITPIRAMASALRARQLSFELHYAARDAAHLAYGSQLQAELGKRLHCYLSARQERLDARALLSAAPKGTVFYVCGPTRLIEAVNKTAQALGIDAERVRFESFS